MEEKAGNKKEIVIKDIERAIYSIYTKEKENNFANIFKMLLLRRDFYDFLDDYKKVFAKNQDEALLILEQFLKKIEHTMYFTMLNSCERKEALDVPFPYH